MFIIQCTYTELILCLLRPEYYSVFQINICIYPVNTQGFIKKRISRAQITNLQKGRRYYCISNLFKFIYHQKMNENYEYSESHC
jgi:hypothetical protein